MSRFVSCSLKIFSITRQTLTVENFPSNVPKKHHPAAMLNLNFSWNCPMKTKNNGKWHHFTYFFHCVLANLPSLPTHFCREVFLFLALFAGERVFFFDPRDCTFGFLVCFLTGSMSSLPSLSAEVSLKGPSSSSELSTKSSTTSSSLGAALSCCSFFLFLFLLFFSSGCFSLTIIKHMHNHGSFCLLKKRVHKNVPCWLHI